MKIKMNNLRTLYDRPEKFLFILQIFSFILQIKYGAKYE